MVQRELTVDTLRRGDIARVLSVSDDDRCILLEFRGGKTMKVTTSDDQLPFSTGSIVFIPEENDVLIPVSPDLWPATPWIAVVERILPDVTLVHDGFRLRQIPRDSKVAYEKGNTVEATETQGILRVLTEEPLIKLSRSDDDKPDISTFQANDGLEELSYDDFGGLEDVVRRAKVLIELPLAESKALQTIGARPIKGVLFSGPPGTGKTMLAKVIASNSDAAFFEISGPQVLSKWYGQTEEVLRDVFRAANREDRAIVFFDEIDSIASRRSEESHSASRRLVAQLLTLMDGFTPNDNVVVIAATNRSQDIDEALKRPGRFDWEIKFPLPDQADRIRILRASEPSSTCDNLPHAWVAEVTDSWSGAELTAIWSEAALFAASEKRDAIMREDYIAGYERVRDQRKITITQTTKSGGSE